MVEALLKSDVDVSILAQDGYTALHRAVRKDHSAIIEMLLAAEAKAKTKSCPRHSRSSFELAAQCGFEDIVRALFSKFQTMQGPPYLLDSGILHLWVNFAYLYAAEHGHRAITVFLHNALNDIHIEALTRYNGMQTLAHAIRQSWPDVVDQLISKHRRDNNTLANKVSSASSGSGSCTTLEDLVTAAKLGNTQVMEQLLRAGVLDNEPSAQRGATTLWPPHSATVQGHLDAMRLLLDWGADPNAQDSFGETPLHLAMWDRRPSMPEIRVLIQRGADVHLLNGRGRSPCFRARDMNAGDLDYLFVESEWHWR
jgi:ankyrin repeat protein